MRYLLHIFILLVLNLRTHAQTLWPVAKSQASRIQAADAAYKNLSPDVIKPSRTISFDTDEASWIDVDISPDGRTILFTILGDLYTMPASGGTAKQLTRGLAINRCPKWSPDRKYIAYISDATGFIRVHISDATGIFHKVLDVGKTEVKDLKLTWFPDGKQILVGRDIYDLTGVRSSLPEEIKKLLGFSADGKFLYSLEEISRDSSAVIKFNKLTSEKSRLLVYDKSWYNIKLFNANISPDGNWLTYIKFDYNDYINGAAGPADSLMIMDLNTGNEKLLVHLGIEFTGFILVRNYSFSKDSKYLFIGYGGKIHHIEIGTGKNEIIPFTSQVCVDMGPLDSNSFRISLDSFEVKYIRSAQRSPDGKHLVFSALNKIYIQDLPNGKPHILADQPFNQFQPAYSTNGKWIAYVSWSDTVGGHVWRILAKGGSPEQITSIAGLYQNPSWSPDGRMLVVAKGTKKLGNRDYPGDGQIEVINLEDKAIKLCADSVPLFNQPVFSRDGKKILFKPNQYPGDNKLRTRLVLVDLDSKVKRDVASARKDNEYFASIRQIILSPDNKHIVFTYNGDLYLTSIANVGSSQMIFDETSQTTLIRFARGGIDPSWEEGGRILSWINANQYCSINPDKIIEAAEHLIANKTLEGLPQMKIIDVDLSADQTIPIHLKASPINAKGIIALKNSRIITMNGNDVIENGTVIIRNGRFVNVGKSLEISIPKEATVFDLKGKTIIPGFIDMHSHMYEAVPPDVFLQQSWHRLLHLSYGVTTMRDPSGSFDTFGYGELVETGQAIGPRLFTVGSAVRPHYNLNSLKEAKVVVNNRAKMGATVIKQYAQETRLQRQLLLAACKQAGVNMTNEVEKDPLYCIGMIKDGSTGVEHNPAWGEIYKDVITLVAKSGTYLCPTLQVSYGFEEGKHYFHKLYGQDFINRSARFMNDGYKKQLLEELKEDKLDSGFLYQSRIDARIKHAGGKIVMGSHGEDQGIGAHWEIWALHMGGLTNMEALQTATITAAEGLGMQKDLGSIEVGKIADLIVLEKNPLEDIHNTTSIKYVMKAGVLYDSETLDEIWPEKKKCPEWRMQTK